MLAEKRMNDLAERRRLLVMEAELHRGIIMTEADSIRSKLEMLAQARGKVYASKPWLAAGGVAAGLLAMRHWRKVVRWAPAALTAFRWVRKLKGQ